MLGLKTAAAHKISTALLAVSFFGMQLGAPVIISSNVSANPNNPHHQNAKASEEKGQGNKSAPSNKDSNSQAGAARTHSNMQPASNKDNPGRQSASQQPASKERANKKTNSETHAHTSRTESEKKATSRTASDPKVMLCHATGSAKNPYVLITVAAAGAANGHYDHQDGRDIIPEFTYNGKTYAAKGDQSVLAAGCKKSTPVTQEPKNKSRVTLCHATGSATNPYVLITIAAAGAANGHYGDKHQDGRDIIPEFTYDGKVYPAQGNQSLLKTGCTVPTSNNSGDEDDGDVLGEVITSTGSPVGGSGGGVFGNQLATTGSNLIGILFASLAIMGLVCALALTTRRYEYQ